MSFHYIKDPHEAPDPKQVTAVSKGAGQGAPCSSGLQMDNTSHVLRDGRKPHVLSVTYGNCEASSSNINSEVDPKKG